MGKVILVYNYSDRARLYAEVYGDPINDSEFAYQSLMEWVYIDRYVEDGNTIVEFLSFTRPYGGNGSFSDENQGYITLDRYIIDSDD